ncbi:hypothetical protein CEXT_413421 [Caerostris extrusa]|uniref:Uncharacterized protein n=1 Tax=Caerostris extrusa TaxID=172846 RepID=A0AAV4MZ02_CAEEX|nr:hypothetical protein CEXT_413421 [Caerostris extrusa]
MWMQLLRRCRDCKDFCLQHSSDPLPSRLFALISRALYLVSELRNIHIHTGPNAHERTIGDLVYDLWEILAAHSFQLSHKRTAKLTLVKTIHVHLHSRLLQ